jgi:hypothetical protein
MTIDNLIQHYAQECNFYNAGHPRGTVCVLRQVQGVFNALAIPQSHYKEWNGCFSIL